MRVLFVTHCVGMAGANRSMLQLVIELRDIYGVCPFVLLPYSSDCTNTLKHHLANAGIEYKETEIVYFKITHINAEARYGYLRNYDKIKVLCEELKQYEFDMVHSNSAVIDIGAYICQELGLRHVWHLREFGDIDYSLHCLFGKRYEKATYTRADAFIAISQAIKTHYSSIIRDSDKIYTIYNGIAPKNNVPFASHTNDTIRFLCAGIINEVKNQIEILYALNELVNVRNIRNVHVTIIGIGSTSQYAQKMKFYCIEHQLTDFVSIEKEIDGISELASTMDVGITPSQCEAFGRVTVEYMLQKLAVIVNDSGANQEIVEHEKSGLVYPHKNPMALADCMQMLIENRSLLKELSNQGYQRANEKFLSIRNTKSVFLLYKRLLCESCSNKNKKSFFITNLQLQIILLYWRFVSLIVLYVSAMCENYRENQRRFFH